MLWDIDGTLLTAGGVAAGAFLDAVTDVVGRRPLGRDLDLGGRIDPEIASALLTSVGADDRLIPMVLTRLQEIALSRSDDFRTHVRPLAGVVETLRALERAEIWQTVVTGNIESVGRLKLESADLVPPIEPGLGGFGDSGPDRAAVARVAVHRLVAAGWQWSPRQCWIVGDTPRDLLCAKALGIRCALVGSGRHPAASLSGLGADVVIAGLDDPAELFALWGMTPGLPNAVTR